MNKTYKVHYVEHYFVEVEAGSEEKAKELAEIEMENVPDKYYDYSEIEEIEEVK